MAFGMRQVSGGFKKLTSLMKPRFNIIKLRRIRYATEPCAKKFFTSRPECYKNYSYANYKCCIDNWEYVKHEVTRIPMSVYTLKNNFLYSINSNLGSEVKCTPKNEPVEGLNDKPSQEHIDHVYNTLSDNLPKFFYQTMDYKIYHPDVIFENNIRGLRTVGLFAYVKQVALLRTIGHFKYAYVRFEVLKITKNPEDSSVKVRWRIRGVSGMRVMFTFWKYKLWELQKIIEQSESWYDGFSTFYINGKGQVVKHVADKMMPDSDQDTAKSPVNAAKVALLLGIIPRFSDFFS